MHAHALLVGHRLAGLLQSAPCTCSSLVSPCPRLKHQATLNNQTLSFLLLDLFSRQPSSRSTAIHHGDIQVSCILCLQFASSRPSGCWEVDDGREDSPRETQISTLILVNNLYQTTSQLVHIVSSFQHYIWIFFFSNHAVIRLLLIPMLIPLLYEGFLAYL